MGSGVSSRIIYNGLKDEFKIEAVIIEKRFSVNKFIKRRIKKYGYWTVFGQLLFQVFGFRVLRYFSRSRINHIKDSFGLCDDSIVAENLYNIESVNSEECLRILNKINPDIIVVNGTRIISNKILRGINSTIINMHTGITPKYRGIFCGYWALVNKDDYNFGVTVHLIDKGIDTGGILNQGHVDISVKDNFSTYMYLQFAEGIVQLKKTINEILETTNTIKKGSGESKLWSHPTLWEYLYHRWVNGVK